MYKVILYTSTLYWKPCRHAHVYGLIKQIISYMLIAIASSSMVHVHVVIHVVYCGFIMQIKVEEK